MMGKVFEIKSYQDREDNLRLELKEKWEGKLYEYRTVLPNDLQNFCQVSDRIDGMIEMAIKLGATEIDIDLACCIKTGH